MTENPCAEPLVIQSPISEQITAEVLRRLRLIDVANGYQFTASDVVLVNRDVNAYPGRTLAIVVVESPSSVNEELSCPGNPAALAWDKVYDINGYASQLDEDGHAIETIDQGVSENQMMAAIQKAITNNDPTMWQAFGGLAMNAGFVASEEFEAPGFDGGRVGLLVTYRTNETDPFVKR